MASKSLRSLMKDRQLAKRIQHQFAKYDSTGRLTCTICNGLTVKSEALWPSHLSSKPHRLNHQSYQNSMNSNRTTVTTKRKTDEMSGIDEPMSQDKKVRFDGPSTSDGDEEEEHNGQRNETQPKSSSSLPAVEEVGDEEDPEWSAFKAALQEPQNQDNSANLFAQASLVAEPILYESGKPSGDNIQDLQQEEIVEEEEEEDPIEKKSEKKRKKLWIEFKSCEEREQLEADQRVLRMKARVNAFRATRKKKSVAE
ncbi:hypothetical protein Pst134EA_031510 [Puccinia striiformis f. sp. tritici]|uniref:uncharacterized protein n=1 Tax=Puccinia striiformis f. sp. tritici TaxID=168172 RepID=UPI0020076CDF|nr:uncharacterized protein Pst134EA_031510 [Puccinia striiformis f. sp. tritici]KAH9445256.1 hypothetical protein Pst134EA_031510 [Puccinia striiformis f. sp. tritici]